MSERQKQHMGRSDEDESRIPGRDVREDEQMELREVEERVEEGGRGFPMPSEEGRARGFQRNARTDAPPDEEHRGRS